MLLMKPIKTGIDIGSTTAKLVLLDTDNKILYADYVRHNTRIAETLTDLLIDIENKFGDVQLKVAFSGSAGMGIAEQLTRPFVQELIAANLAALKFYPDIKSLIDIGGEDAKLVLFHNQKKPDIRMNGNCAGGTGAYIDQMASLLNVPVSELNLLAWQSDKRYPIASRCGVFAKTDVQNLISRKVAIADIAASIFDAVANQTINSLARGCEVEPKLLFCGGPLTYISYLRKSFTDLLGIPTGSIVVPERGELFIALGTALSVETRHQALSVSELIELLNKKESVKLVSQNLKPLFGSQDSFMQWQSDRLIMPVSIKEPENRQVAFLGIDSGSTTTKITIIDSNATLIFSHYQNNNGKPLETVIEGLKLFNEKLNIENKVVDIKATAVTGYGEDLIKSAFGMDYGLVETVAHFLAARKIEPKVSFILDIGGQDIKAIFVQNHSITNIEINEACSSGCGSFIEGFANTLGYSPAEFSNLAIDTVLPYDLGSRCTVFMNSKVKQALRDGATIADLSAGLAYSVVKNCLNKVLKIKSYSEIGETIVVQGGTFKNNAVFRALEILSGKKIVMSDKPELMGAYGAALYAMEKCLYTEEQKESSFIGLQNLESICNYTTKQALCKGCNNHCQVTVFKFSNNQTCFSGNKCEKFFSNNPFYQEKGENIFDYKKEKLFAPLDFRHSGKEKKLKIGIPRILNMYENYPFWNSLFTTCGFELVLSDESTMDLYKKGTGTIMSDNICFPAKLAHGHFVNLIEKGVDRIFIPFVVFEKKQLASSSNSFNCPIITGYSEVLKSTSTLLESSHLPIDTPSINFNDLKLLEKACYTYFKTLSIKKSTFSKAFKEALNTRHNFKNQLITENWRILNLAISNHKPVVLVASHPYHTDQLIHQKVSQMLSDLGVAVINEEIAQDANNEGFDKFFAVSQWEYPNRILQAVYWATQQDYEIGVIQLNSFGCGPDSFIIDEISDMVKRTGLSYSLVRIDEISSPGSTKLRLRSLVESLRLKTDKKVTASQMQNAWQKLAIFKEDDMHKTVLVPWFSDFYSPFVPILAKKAGYNLVNLAPSDQQSIDLGLDYSNNEVCYPATLVVGDVLKELKKGTYRPEDIAIGMTQTGGQCRATNYIALIKRALLSAGYNQIPVVSIASSSGLNNSQPGFKPNWFKILMPTAMALLFADSLSRIYYSTVCREKNKGQTLVMLNYYLKKAVGMVEKGEHHQLLDLLKSAVLQFDQIPVNNQPVQSVGIVGEIYIKYNSFGQFNVIDWLIENNVEVVLPPLFEFFTQSFVNNKVNYNDFISQPSSYRFIESLIGWRVDYIINSFEKVLEKYRFYRPVHSIGHEAKEASKILSLANQYGEGWLIPAEISAFARQGITDIICMQPFGCIANHVVGKGMEKKIRKLYPEINLLFLDFDYGTSRVNILNRLHFLIQNQQSIKELILEDTKKIIVS
jgi:predicted CoA-substrate-specific enzyme activase